MKKAVCLLLCLVCVSLALFSCAGAPRIERESWVLATATHYGEIICVSSDYAASAPSAEVIDCTLTAKGGTLTVKDNTNGLVFTGAYEKREEPGPTTADHSVSFQGARGRILLSRTALAEGEDSVPTLTLTVDEYALSFVAKK